MISQHPLVFLGIVALLTITPGADMAMVALGVAAVLAASQTAYDALRLVGAAYLVWLGIQSLLAARWSGYGAAAAAAAAAPRRTSPFRQGLLTNLLNPKIAVFYSTFLPQFIAPGDSALAVSMLLACVHITLGILWLSLYAWLLGRAVEAFKGSRLRRALDALTGTVLVALGLRLAAERR